MDSIGLLAAWTSVVSFFVAVMVAIAFHLFGRRCQRWWARTSSKRSEKRLQQLLAYRKIDPRDPGTGYVGELVALYGSAMLTLVAAIGLVILSIVILDLGPAIIAAAELPFRIDVKLLIRATGLVMLFIGYFFIFRLSYLGIQIRREVSFRRANDREELFDEIFQLRERLGLTRDQD
jgi:hypothetical protein